MNVSPFSVHQKINLHSTSEPRSLPQESSTALRREHLRLRDLSRVKWRRYRVRNRPTTAMTCSTRITKAQWMLLSPWRQTRPRWVPMERVRLRVAYCNFFLSYATASRHTLLSRRCPLAYHKSPCGVDSSQLPRLLSFESALRLEGKHCLCSTITTPSNSTVAACAIRMTQMASFCRHWLQIPTSFGTLRYSCHHENYYQLDMGTNQAESGPSIES